MNRDKELQKITSLEKELSELKKLITDDTSFEQRMEDLFFELMNKGLTVKYDKNLITWSNKEGDIIVLYHIPVKYIYFNYTLFWSHFEDRLRIDYHTVYVFLLTRFRYHFDINCQGCGRSIGISDIYNILKNKVNKC